MKGSMRPKDFLKSIIYIFIHLCIYTIGASFAIFFLAMLIRNPLDAREGDSTHVYWQKKTKKIFLVLTYNCNIKEYEERRICEEAIDSLHGTEFQGSNLRVEFAHGERSGNFKYGHHHHHHHSNHHHHHNGSNNRGGETKSTDTCFKCGLVGHWARECTR